MKTPTAREFNYDKPTCMIVWDSCNDWFEPIDGYKGCANCSKCKFGIEHKNKSSPNLNNTTEKNGKKS